MFVCRLQPLDKDTDRTDEVKGNYQLFDFEIA